jgi:predicted nucleic acid-binding protein
MRKLPVVVDSNLAVFTVVDTQLSPLAVRVWNYFIVSQVSIYAPGLWSYETTSVIRKYCSLGKITNIEAEESLIILNQMQVQFVPEDLRLRQAALLWATRLQQKDAYDGFYLAAAEQLDAELWTADQSLVNNSRQIGVDWVHWMGEKE